MKPFKSIPVYIFSLFLMNLMHAQNEISVTVKTNVNSFKCAVENASLKSIKQDQKTTISIPVKSFKCPKRMIEKDLQEIFEAEKFPYITLTVDSLSKKSKILKTQLKIKNTKKNYNINIHHSPNSIEGNQSISLNDFGIEPPTKMMGTVKVKDDVKINFKLDNSILNHP